MILYLQLEFKILLQEYYKHKKSVVNNPKVFSYKKYDIDV